MSGATKYTIGEIVPNVNNAMIVAIIIAKQQPRTITSRIRGPGNERTVWNFTIRDSPTDTINVSLWGNVDFVQNMADSLHIGNVVEIINARVVFRQGGQEERFTPSVSSEFMLNVDEVHSVLQLHTETQGTAHMKQLLRIPNKPTTDFLTLADVERKGADGFSRSKETADLLVAVCKVCPVRNIVTKRDGSSMQLREVLLLDYTVSGIILNLWDSELIERANHWTPGHTVLFLADSKVEWNDFKKQMVVSTGQRTIVTEDPVSDEADALRTFASQAPLDLVDQMECVVSSITNVQSINTVMSVKQLLEEMAIEGQLTRQIYALLFCIPTMLDIDGCTQVLNRQCAHCKAIVDERVGMCEKKCIFEGSHIHPDNFSFDIRVTLTDHTGSLPGVRLTGTTAEEVLGVTAQDYAKMDPDTRTKLKWELLLERCAVRVVVMRPRANQTRPLVSVLACERADPKEAAARSPAN